MVQQLQTTLVLLRRREVERRTGLTRSPLYERIKAGAFPTPVRLGNSRAVGWIESEVNDWIAEQIENARKAA